MSNAPVLTQPHLADFEEWLITKHGWQSYPLKGPWEALRVQSPEGDGHQLLYKNSRNNKLKADGGDLADLARQFRNLIAQVPA